MGNDSLRLFNTKFVEPLVSMSDDELWNFLLGSEEKLKQYFGETGKHPKTGALYAYQHGIEHFRKHFLSEIEEYREGVIFTLVVDFCFEGEPVRLDYWARCGYLDSADSCGVKTSDDVMPPVDPDSEEANWAQEYFHLLEFYHVQHIIDAMEKNFDKLTDNTREDIDRIREMKNFCLANRGYHVAYIYNI